jgi:hypothetical protein
MKMKTGISLAVALVLLGAGCFGSQVREIYSIKDFGFSMSFPEEFDVVTQDIGDVTDVDEIGFYPHTLDLWLRGPQVEEYLDIAPVIRLQVSPVELTLFSQYEYQVDVRPDGKLILGERMDTGMTDAGNIGLAFQSEAGMYYTLNVSAANEEIADDVFRDISAHFEILFTDVTSLEANPSEE